jgi:hypothetical protein
MSTREKGAQDLSPFCCASRQEGVERCRTIAASRPLAPGTDGAALGEGPVGAAIAFVGEQPVATNIARTAIRRTSLPLLRVFFGAIL